MDVADGRVLRDRGGKRDQFAAIIFGIGKCDQALMAASVMPRQLSAWQIGGQALVEDALLAFDDAAIVFIVVAVGSLADGGWWQLFGIANNYDLYAARYGADSIPNRN